MRTLYVPAAGTWYIPPTSTFPFSLTFPTGNPGGYIRLCATTDGPSPQGVIFTVTIDGGAPSDSVCMSNECYSVAIPEGAINVVVTVAYGCGGGDDTTIPIITGGSGDPPACSDWSIYSSQQYTEDFSVDYLLPADSCAGNLDIAIGNGGIPVNGVTITVTIDGVPQVSGCEGDNFLSYPIPAGTTSVTIAGVFGCNDPGGAGTYVTWSGTATG